MFRESYVPWLWTIVGNMFRERHVLWLWTIVGNVFRESHVLWLWTIEGNVFRESHVPWLWTMVVNVFRESHVPCMLNASSVDLRKRVGALETLQKTKSSSLSNSSVAAKSLTRLTHHSVVSIYFLYIKKCMDTGVLDFFNKKLILDYYFCLKSGLVFLFQIFIIATFPLPRDIKLYH